MKVYVSEISTLKLVLMITFHKNSAGCTALNVLSHLCSLPRLTVVLVCVGDCKSWTCCLISRAFIKQCDYSTWPAAFGFLIFLARCYHGV